MSNQVCLDTRLVRGEAVKEPLTDLAEIVELLKKHENNEKVLKYKDAVIGESQYLINTESYAGHSFDVDAYYASLSQSGGRHANSRHANLAHAYGCKN
jgi:hypothetical protein